tara:strand:- start:2380 stop:3435 length:1056 start_codon:yes stop_codon:yes gene_type:complete
MEKINIVIPMAGEGSRFKKSGFKNIKPLIPLNGKTFIEWSIDSVDFQDIQTQFIFIIQEKHKKELYEYLKKIKPNCLILTVQKLTRGATETALIAKNYINNDIPLIITNCDQIFEWDKQKYLNYLKSSNIDGNVVTVKETTDKFSYIKVDEEGYGVEVAEKVVISDEALSGIHYWKNGSYFVKSGEELIEKNIRANNEFYISLTYNMMIKDNLKITAYPLKDTEKYLSIGTPEQVLDYLRYKNLDIKINNIKNMTRGWFIGNFKPSVYETENFEVGYLTHNKGEKWPIHYHEKMTEINVLIKGKMKLNDKIINEGDIFTFVPYGVANPEFIEDCKVLCIKVPSVLGDKVIM